MQGPRLYRFFNYEGIAYLPAPEAGWNPDANPWLLPDSQAAVLDNFLIRPGKIQVRGPMQVAFDMSAALITPPCNACGIQYTPYSERILVTRKNVDATAYVDPWNAPIIRPSSAAALAGASTTVLSIGASGGTTASVSGPPGPRGIDFNGTRYYIAYDGDSGVQDTSGTYYAHATTLHKITGATTVASISGAPQGALDLKGYQSRVWLLGGVDTPGSGSTFSPTKLFFTNPLTAPASADDWKDPVSGLTNQIEMDADYSDPGIALATVPNALIILRYGSIWVLRGTTSASYTLAPISREVGCIDARSVVETDEGVFFLSPHGLMLTDGTTIKNVTTDSLLYTLQSAVSVYQSNIVGGFGGYATCAKTSEGSLLVSIGVAAQASGEPTGNVQPVWCALFDPTNSTWTRITSKMLGADGVITVSGNDYPAWVFTLPDSRVFALGDIYLTSLENPGTPLAVPLPADNDPTSATEATNGAGSLSWGFLSGNAAELVRSGSVHDPTATSYFLLFEDCGFSIPSTATINGIQVSLQYQEGGGTTEQHVRLLQGGSAVGTDLSTGAVLPKIEKATTVYGGNSTLWGTSWTPSQINSSGFGVELSYTDIPPVATLDVYNVTIEVTYTTEGATQIQSFIKYTDINDQDADSNLFLIPAIWKTKMIPVGTAKRAFALGKRFIMDYVFQTPGDHPDDGFQVDLQDATGASLLGTTATVPKITAAAPGSVSGGLTLPAVKIQRYNQDFTKEFSDIYFVVSLPVAMGETRAEQPVLAEIYGFGLEYQATRDLR